ncbi:hypothetical protein GSI_07635 [Ganoderma sinense ZZ0214-1]|uniref:BTB domain-containing protein n=1 Tax=Ganoderma sinense ZZ0214-1 TaxID=1077348 RepID=A0A2G8S933_9APHY|nr:hypothetical protein GSI_07635 [Ganoderma sinense ZZ0214-1]
MERTERDEFVRFTKDEDFWYEDGDVLLLIGNTGLRLHESRVAGYCGYFHELFGPGNPAGVVVTGEAAGCRVYPVTPELSLEDFKHLLKAIESPFEYATSPPSQQVAIALLFAAHILSCGYVLDLAKKRLCDIWDGRTPPTTDRSDGEDRSPDSAIRAIKLGRRYGIPGVLKRAFYELLSSWIFGRESESVTFFLSVIGELTIAEDDIHRLLAARLKLGRLWRKFVVDPPSGAWCVSQDGACSARRCCHAGESKDVRAGEWRNVVCEQGLLEVVDPLRYDLTKDWRIIREAETWCQGCLESKRQAWEEMRVEWWNEMDAWFDLSKKD